MTVTSCAPYLHSFKVFPLQLQAVGSSGPSDHFGDSVGDLLHGAFYSIHCRLRQMKNKQQRGGGQKERLLAYNRSLGYSEVDSELR